MTVQVAKQLIRIARLLIAREEPRPTLKGLGPYVSQQTRERATDVFHKLTKDKRTTTRTKRYEQHAVARTKKYLGELTGNMRGIVEELQRDYADEPELAKLIWAALSASLRFGPRAIVKREVAPVQEWQYKPGDAARRVASPTSPDHPAIQQARKVAAKHFGTCLGAWATLLKLKGKPDALGLAEESDTANAFRKDFLFDWDPEMETAAREAAQQAFVRYTSELPGPTVGWSTQHEVALADLKDAAVTAISRALGAWHFAWDISQSGQPQKGARLDNLLDAQVVSRFAEDFPAGLPSKWYDTLVNRAEFEYNKLAEIFHSATRDTKPPPAPEYESPYTPEYLEQQKRMKQKALDDLNRPVPKKRKYMAAKLLKVARMLLASDKVELTPKQLKQITEDIGHVINDDVRIVSIERVSPGASVTWPDDVESWIITYTDSFGRQGMKEYAPSEQTLSDPETGDTYKT